MLNLFQHLSYGQGVKGLLPYRHAELVSASLHYGQEAKGLLPYRHAELVSASLPYGQQTKRLLPFRHAELIPASLPFLVMLNLFQHPSGQGVKGLLPFRHAELISASLHPHHKPPPRVMLNLFQHLNRIADHSVMLNLFQHPYTQPACRTHSSIPSSRRETLADRRNTNGQCPTL